MGRKKSKIFKGQTKARKKAKKPKVTSSTFTTRNRAIRRLGLPMQEFRRLCILKGIHPRVPPKTVTKQGGKRQNYYLSKDINHLFYDPLLTTLRLRQSLSKKITKAKGRGENEKFQRLMKKIPDFQLDHIVKERYPTFQSALRDLSDALYVLSLISSLPVSPKVPLSHIVNATTLLRQFLALVMENKLLDRVFLSIKGIYYQVTIQGQAIVWVTPYEFPQTIPSQIDIKLIMTYAEFYEVLLTFVNFRLYTLNGLRYPPPLKEDNTKSKQPLKPKYIKKKKNDNVEEEKEEETGKRHKTEQELVLERQRLYFLNSVVLQRIGGEENISKQNTYSNTQKQITKSKQLADSLPKKIHQIAESEKKRPSDIEQEGNEEETEESENQEESEDNQNEGDEKEDEEIEAIDRDSHNLFEGLHFFLSREVPKQPFEFMICSYGGRVSWDDELSPSITHQIVDRSRVPNSSNNSVSFLNRIYIQPQWIADCINSKFLLPVSEYLPGCSLPPHLSPFLSFSSSTITSSFSLPGEDGLENEDFYVPQRQIEINEIISGKKIATKEKDVEDDDNLADDKEEFEREEMELKYLKELSKEHGNTNEEENHESVQNETKKNKNKNFRKNRFRNEPEEVEEIKYQEGDEEDDNLLRVRRKQKLEQRKKQKENEEIALRKDMLPRKKRRIYDSLSRSEQRKRERIEGILHKRSELDKRRKESE